MGTACRGWLSLIHPSQVPGITGEPGAPLAHIPLFETNKDWTAPCVIMGQLRADGAVAWFAVLETTTFDGALLAAVGNVAEIEPSARSLTTLEGLEFRLSAETSDCGHPLTEVAGMRAFADWTTGGVVALLCLDDG